MGHVICPETIVGPAPNPEFLRAFPGLQPNEPCALRCEVITPAPVMDFRCPRGHRFFAEPKDVLEDR